MPNITINVPVRSIHELTPLSINQADYTALGNMKIPVGNVPIGVTGEAISLQQLLNILPVSAETKKFIQQELVNADSTNYNLVLAKITGEISRATSREDYLEAKINTNLNGMSGYASRAIFDALATKPPANSVVLIGEGETAKTYVWDGVNLNPANFDYEAMINTVKDYIESQITRISTGVTALNLFLNKLQIDQKSQIQQFEDQINERLLKLVTTEQIIMRLLAKARAAGTSSADVEPILLDTGNYSLGKPTGLIVINYDTSVTNLPTAKGTVIQGQVSINVDGQILKCFSTLEVQGSGSAAYPKKNWTIGLFSDSEMTKEISLSIGGLLPQQEWVYKSNYTDKSQVRNLMCYNLWGEFLKRRKGNFPVYEIDYSYVNSSGDMINTNGLSYPTGFNCVLNINGAFYGIGQLMTGKKKENFNIAKNSPKQIMVALSNTPGFRMDTLPNGTFELRFPSKPTDVTNKCLDDWRAFASSSLADFNTNKSKFLDSRNASDFYIYSQFIGNIDGVTNNTNLGTWDGQKWLFIPYDMDLTFKDFRMSADSTDIFEYEYLNLEFWNKIKSAYKTQINARYAELRSSILNVTNMRNMYLQIANQFTTTMHNAELTKWANREATSPYGGGEISTYNIEQFCNWVARRIVYLDKMFSYTGS